MQYIIDDFEALDPFAMLQDPKVVIDLGANVGMWAFWVAKRFPKCRVYAVEPHPINVMNLRMGINKNGFDNITVLPAAVSRKSEFITLWMELSNSGAVGVHNYVYPNMYPTMVPAFHLNTIFATIPEYRIDHMKVDIEGPEFTMLPGFKYWHRLKSLRMEIHPFPQFREKEKAIRKVKQLGARIAHRMEGKPFELIGGVNEEQYT